MCISGSEVISLTRSRKEAAASYDRLSRWYDLLAERSERRARELGLRMLGAQEGETALEVGVGTGQSLLSLVRSVGSSGRVFGIDLSLGMLGIAKARVKGAGLEGRVDLLAANATSLPFKEDSFDALFMSFVLELFDNPDMALVLGECRRVLRAGGRLGVVALSAEGEPGVVRRLYEWAHRRFPNLIDCRPIQVTRLLEQAGFRIQEGAATSMWGLPVEIVVALKVGPVPH